MELFNEKEIKTILNRFENLQVVNWSVENYSDKMIGYLGDHLRLKVTVKSGNVESVLRVFVKCMPRNDEWKANYLKDLGFFDKEYIMLSKLFKDMENKTESSSKWRPNLFYIREDLFVAEDVAELGYEMPNHLHTMKYEEIMATVETLAKFHAQSLIYEQKKSIELGKSYRIWDEYEGYLKEPHSGYDWRNAGRNAVIDFLKVYSAHKLKPNFKQKVESIIPMLFEGALSLMKPSVEFRNVVIHRDLWTNNIFVKQLGNGKLHSIVVDFQTVLYCPPMLDLSSLIFFNTTKSFRNRHTSEIIDFYYDILKKELELNSINIETILRKEDLFKSYEESVMFGITQAALIVPIVAMSIEKREELFSNPENCVRVNVVSRSNEFIQIAKDDNCYRLRVTEIFDDIVERYIFAETNE